MSGEDKLSGFGSYSLIRQAAGALVNDDTAKAMKAYEVFAYILYNQITAMVEYKTNIYFSNAKK